MYDPSELAVKLCRRGIELDQENVDLHLDLAGVQWRLGRLAEMVSTLETAAKLDPGNGNIQDMILGLTQDPKHRKAVKVFTSKWGTTPCIVCHWPRSR